MAKTAEATVVERTGPSCCTPRTRRVGQTVDFGIEGAGSMKELTDKLSHQVLKYGAGKVLETKCLPSHVILPLDEGWWALAIASKIQNA